MKFALATVAYNEPRFIVPFVRHYKPLVDHLVVLNSAYPWNGILTAFDRTMDLATCAGATVYQKDWRTEEEQRNSGLSLLSGYDWVFILDPDEFIETKTFVALKYFLSEAKHVSYTCPMITYWKKGYTLYPQDTHQPCIAVRPNLVRFLDKRGVDDQHIKQLQDPFILHHFSWARTDEEVWNKLTHFAHAQEFNTKEWYENVWLKWHPAMNYLHPMRREKWFQAIPQEPPLEFKHLLEGI